MSQADKKKLPVGTFYCTFEALRLKETGASDIDGNLETEWFPLRSYYLYVFKESGGTLSCLNKDKPAKPFEKPEANNLYKCDFPFARGKVYFCYFAGKELDQEEIKELQNGRSNVLIAVVPKGSGRIRIEQNFFYWISLLHRLEPGFSTARDFMTHLLKIYAGEATGSNLPRAWIQKWIKNNYYIILPNYTIININHVLIGIKEYIADENPSWAETLGQVVIETIDLIEQPEKYPFSKIYTREGIWEKKEMDKASPITLFGDMHGFVIGKDKGSILGGDLVNLYQLSNVFEDYFSKNELYKEVVDIFSNEYHFEEV